MSEPTPIVVPRENVNDESATLVAWSVVDGSRVEPGQVVAQIETSKAVVDLPAPSGGILHHAAAPGQDVAIGALIGSIRRDGADSGNGVAASPSPSHAMPPSVRRIVAESGIDPAQVRGTGRGGRLTKADVIAHMTDADPGPAKPARFSRGARELVQELGLDERLFEGQGLVRSRDILARTGVGPTPGGTGGSPTSVQRPLPLVGEPPVPPGLDTQPAPIAATGVETRSERLPRSKRTEAKYLRSGRETTLASVVTVGCPTRGFREAVGRQPAVAGNPTAVIVFETARLLRKYPAFNAFHVDGEVRYYEQVNVGFAVDAGRGLKVTVIKDADRKGIAEIADEMRELVVAYLDDRLTVESLAGGTFTITDLSGEGVSAFHPLINQGQSAILGVCAETILPGGAGTFNLVLAFDHQLAEGRTAARFLNDLRERLAYHESALPREGGSTAEEPRCAMPGRFHRPRESRPAPGPDDRGGWVVPAALQALLRGVDLMETAVQLRKAVAEFFEVDEGQVGPSFSLSGRRGQGSIARAALDSVIRNRVGIKSRAVYTARTFGELEGEIVPGSADGATASASAPVPAPGPVELPAGGHMPPAVGTVSCGVDIESIENLPAAADYWEDPFYRTVFSPSEIAYCVLQETPALHFAARWCAKEALKKCDRELLGADLKDLEVVPDEAGAPYFVQHAGGTSRRLPHAVSLSHTSQAAVAVVIRAIMPEPATPAPAMSSLVPPVVPEPRSRGSKLLIALNLITLGVAVLALLRTFRSVESFFAR